MFPCFSLTWARLNSLRDWCSPVSLSHVHTVVWRPVHFSGLPPRLVAVDQVPLTVSLLCWGKLSPYSYIYLFFYMCIIVYIVFSTMDKLGTQILSIVERLFALKGSIAKSVTSCMSTVTVEWYVVHLLDSYRFHWMYAKVKLNWFELSWAQEVDKKWFKMQLNFRLVGNSCFNYKITCWLKYSQVTGLLCKTQSINRDLQTIE